MILEFHDNSPDVKRAVAAAVVEESTPVPARREEKSFSWWRIAGAVTVAMGLVVPTLFYVTSSGALTGNRRGASDRNVEPAGFGLGGRRGSPFDLSQATVPVDQIHSGGPPKDGIPALSKPKLIAAKAATYLEGEDRVIGLVHLGDARAYPLKILNFHEIVNDRVGELPVAVTYCPLCDSAAVFNRRTETGQREFGVSGLLYNSNVLMYDRTVPTESLWSQIKAEGVSGPGARQRVELLPLELTTWANWIERHPDTQVLSTETGHDRDYGRSPYARYFETSALMFPAQPFSDRLPVKEPVLGVRLGKTTRAYPLSAFTPERPVVQDPIGEGHLVVEYVHEAKSLRVAEADPGIEWMYSLWFSWYAMHPDTEVFQSDPSAP